MRRAIGCMASALACIALATACGNATAPAELRAQLAAHQAQWNALHITSYQYDYSEMGFFSGCGGGPVRLYVHAGAVDSAVVLSTGQPSPALAQCWPTIDGLFAIADSAAAHGRLGGIRYDLAFGYPTEIDLPGPPDASGSFFASALRKLP